MSTWWARWRVALRIARRDALRSRGRSILVVAMVALPVLGVGAADVLARTYELSPAQKAERSIGQADFAVTDTGATTVEQDTTGPNVGYGSSGDERPALTAAQVTALLPAGTRTLSIVTDYQNTPVTNAEGSRRVRASTTELDLTAPLAHGLWIPSTGGLARTSDEVVLSDRLAERLGVAVDDTVTIDDAARRVVGTVASPRNRDELAVLLAPGALAADGADVGPATSLDRRILVADPSADWTLVQRLNAHGLFVDSPVRLPGSPPPPSSPVDAQAITALALVVGMIVLEIVLLAGPAFAVGAKRRERELALLAATGGSARDVRRVVLGGGVVLGAAAGVIGVVLGAALAAVAIPVIGHFDSSVPGPFELRPLDLVAIVGLAVLVALLAAVVPARAASRQDPLAGLTGRRGTVHGRAWVPVAGLVATVLGAAVAYYGASRRDVTVILVGSIVAELGLVATTPFLVGLVGRLGPRLPVAPRLALRDAARNRGRTAPAVSAILAAVAGAVAISTFVASQDARDQAQYTPAAPAGVVTMHLPEAADTSTVPASLARALQSTLPVQGLVTLGSLTSDGAAGYIEVLTPPERQCPLAALNRKPTTDEARAAATDPRCTAGASTGYSGRMPEVVVAGAQAAAAATGDRDPALATALSAGTVVAPPSAIADDGTITVVLHPADDPDGTHGTTVRTPAMALPAGSYPIVVVPPAVAQKFRVPVKAVSVAGVLTRAVTTADVDRADAAVGDAGSLYIERGYQSQYGIGLLALLIGSAVIVLGASGIATGLAAADGRADLSTLAAVGATPGLRRRLAAFQSAVTAGLGTLMGVVAGLVPALGLLRALNGGDDQSFIALGGGYPLVVPWQNLLVLGLLVPALAALAAAALTRSRLVIVRRTA